MTLDETFGHVVDALERSGVRFAFMGALGAIAWGRARTTSDLDAVVVVSEAQFASLSAELRSRGFTVGQGVGPAEPTDSLPDIAQFWLGSDPAVRVDVFVAKLPFENEVVDTALDATLFDRVVRVARPEAMIVYKLLASREKDLTDIDAIVHGRAAVSWPIDWPLVIRWATDWGIEDRVEALRARFPSA